MCSICNIVIVAAFDSILKTVGGEKKKPQRSFEFVSMCCSENTHLKNCYTEQ